MARKRRRRRARARVRGQASSQAAGDGLRPVEDPAAPAGAKPVDGPAGAAPLGGPAGAAPLGGRARSRARWAVALVLVLTAAVYGPNLDHSFQFDDEWKILDNPMLREPSAYLEHFIAGRYSERTTRFVANMTYVLNHALFGYEPFGWHLTNLLLHLVNVALVAGFGWALVSRLPGASFAGVALGAAIFALHPLNTEAVNYCNARPNVLVTSFYLATLLASLAALEQGGGFALRRRALWGAAGVSLLLALFSKELAVTLCLMAPMTLAWLWFGSGGRHGIPLPRMGPAFGALAVVGLATLLATGAYKEVIRVIFQRGASETGHWASYLLVTLLGQSEVFLRYLGLALLPLPRFLNMDRRAMGHLHEHMYEDGELVDASVSTLALPVISFILVLLALVALIRFRRRAPLYTLLGLWPFVTHAPTSLVPRGEVMVEYRTYLPMVGVCLLLGIGIERSLASLARRFGDDSPAVLIRVVSVGVVVLLSAGTVVRNRAWADPRSMWEDVAAKSPDNPRAYNSLGMLDLREGDRRSAIGNFVESIELSPTYGVAHGNLGGMLAQDGHYEKAIEHLTLATQHPPPNPEAHNNLANVLLREGRFEEAIEHYDKALSLNPRMGEAMANKGRAYEGRGELERALELYRKAIEIDPGFAGSYYRLGNLLVQRGQVERGIALLKRALAMDPSHAHAHLRLGAALFGRGQEAVAARHLRRALQLDPRLTQARSYLRAMGQR